MAKKINIYIKGCINNECISNIDETKYDRTYIYCPMCANKLIYVCREENCYNEVRSVRKKYCNECLHKREANAETRSIKTERSISIASSALNLFSNITDVVFKLKPESSKKDTPKNKN